MRAIVLPLILASVGVAGGAGAGWILRYYDKIPSSQDTPMATKPAEGLDNPGKPDATSAYEDRSGNSEFVKLNNQFVVPVVSDEVVQSLVLMSLSLEVEVGMRAKVYEREPKLRDALLQVMFDHANIGGFDGSFTDANNLDILRIALTDAARGVMQGVVLGVLIVDIARQDI